MSRAHRYHPANGSRQSDVRGPCAETTGVRPEPADICPRGAESSLLFSRGPGGNMKVVAGNASVAPHGLVVFNSSLFLCNHQASFTMSRPSLTASSHASEFSSSCQLYHLASKALCSVINHHPTGSNVSPSPPPHTPLSIYLCVHRPRLSLVLARCHLSLRHARLCPHTMSSSVHLRLSNSHIVRISWSPGSLFNFANSAVILHPPHAARYPACPYSP
jgi:hypothetical protein